MLALLLLIVVAGGFVYTASKASEASRLYDQGVKPDQVSNRITRSLLEARHKQEGTLQATSHSNLGSVNTLSAGFLGLVVGACASYLFAPTTLLGKPSFMQWMTEGYQVGQFRTTILICAGVGALIGGALGRIVNK